MSELDHKNIKMMLSTRLKLVRILKLIVHFEVHSAQLFQTF